MSTIFFPLRTSVELFNEPLNPAATARVKQAAILYDKVILEAGLFRLNQRVITYSIDYPWLEASRNQYPDAPLSRELDYGLYSNGRSRRRASPIEPTQTSWDEYIPPEKIGESQLELLAQRGPAMKEGEVYRHCISTGRGLVRPAWNNATVVLNGVAQWESLFRELAPYSPDWIEKVDLRKWKAPNKLLTSEWFDTAVNPEELEDMGGYGEYLWSHRYFHRDALVASRLGAALNLVHQFTPVVVHYAQASRRTRELDIDLLRSGQSALEIAAPNVATLPWEVIFEFRQHPGSEEARARLRDMENIASVEESLDVERYRRLAQLVADELFAAWDDLRTKESGVIREIVLAAIGFIPIVGNFLTIPFTIGKKLDEVHDHNRSWKTALMLLRQ